MMTETKDKPAIPYVRKLVIPMLAGAVIGALTSATLIGLIDGGVLAGLSRAAEMALFVAALYFVVGLGVLAGALSPKLGARFLNVEDAEELREQRRMLLASAVAMALWGLALFALALAGPDGPLPRDAAGLIGALGLIGGGLLAWKSYRESDELLLAVNLEAGAISYGLMLAVYGGWAILAHLAYVAAPQPLDILTGFYALVLVGTFAAAGRRGMLRIK